MKIFTRQLEESKAPLYYKYSTQVNPQPAHIEIDPRDESVTADSWGGIGPGVPAEVFNDLVLWVNVCPYVSGRALSEFLQSQKFKNLVKRIFAGHSVNGPRGKLTEDAADARDQIELLAEGLETITVLNAEDWLQAVIHYRHNDDGDAIAVVIDDIGKITADTTDEEIRELTRITEEELERDIDADAMVLGVGQYLEYLKTEVTP